MRLAQRGRIERGEVGGATVDLADDDLRRACCDTASSTEVSPSGSPHHRVGTDGRRSCSPSRRSQTAGMNGISPGFSSTPAPRPLTSRTRPRRTASVSPATPSCEPARSSSGSHHSASTRRRITSTRSCGSCCGKPAGFIHTQPSRTTRSSPCTSGKPRMFAMNAWSYAVSECVPGESTTTRGSATSAGAAWSSAARSAEKYGSMRCRPASSYSSGSTRDSTRRFSIA